MANRLSKIYTRTGDAGKTSLANGTRISKTQPIFEAMGDIDELNAHIGMAKCSYLQQDNPPTDVINIEKSLTIIQHLLFNLGGELAMAQSEYAYQGIQESYVQWLEQEMDTMNTHLLPLKEFILPAGTPVMCQLHLARTVCRRAERHAILLNDEQADSLHQTGLCFLNRLSDWLFVASRFVGLQLSEDQQKEVLWNNEILDM